MEVDTFEQWMDTLSVALQRAEAMGMSKEMITRSATELGNFLADNVEPDVSENKLLKALWEKGTNAEKKSLASMVVKVVDSRIDDHYYQVRFINCLFGPCNTNTLQNIFCFS